MSAIKKHLVSTSLSKMRSPVPLPKWLQLYLRHRLYGKWTNVFLFVKINLLELRLFKITGTIPLT